MSVDGASPEPENLGLQEKFHHDAQFMIFTGLCALNTTGDAYGNE